MRFQILSTGHAGKSLVHSVTASSGATAISLPGLSQFSKISAGNPQNYNGSVMLIDNTFVEATPNQAYTQLDFVIEGYTNDDASLLLQVTTAENLAEQEFMLTRPAHPEQSVGALINEANYAKFTANDLAKLMTNGVVAQAADVVGHTYTCSSYSKLDNAEINLKSRTYFVANNGTLQSASDIEGANLTWTQAAVGLAAVIANRNGCGNYATYNVVRKTPSGGLIAEVNLDLNAYVDLCANAGYDADGTRAVETNSTFPSVLNPNYVVDSYEYCHQ